MTIDCTQAQTFLALLDPKATQFTFQTFDDNPERKDKKLARVLHGSLDQVWDELERLNNEGAGVFITVNETDGQGRTSANVVRVRALFVDLDGAPLLPILNNTLIPKPHIVVESSPGRWHCYWLVDGMKLEEFTAAQKLLIARFNSDKAVHDLPRVLRLPGFVHQKGEPFTTKLISSNTSAPFDAETFLAPLTASTPVPEPVKTTAPDEQSEAQEINAAALKNLSAWVPRIFPNARARNDGYRITSKMLGRELEEDLSLTPEGIKDFGIADTGDEREGKRTAIDIVMEYAQLDFNAAQEWLRRALGGTDLIIMRDGTLMEIIDKAENALIAKGFPIYQRSGELVMPDKGRQAGDSIKRDLEATVLFAVNPEWLIQLMDESIKWAKFNTRGKLKPADPALKYAMALLARPPSKWKFPKLLGVINAPTLGRKGEIIETPGYHADTELLLDFKEGTFPKIPTSPTKKNALVALEKLNHPMRGFPFDGETATQKTSPSRSVALSAMLSALVRSSLRTVPLHGFDAPTAGTGKSILAEAPALLASGTKPASMSQGKSPEEDEKRLATVLHAGDTVIMIDNCQKQVTGDFLCSMLTQEKVQARILGQSERRILPCTALVVCTGNNLTFAGDVTRRTVRCGMDAKEERPDQRKFSFNFQEEVLANRADLVVAGLTVLRAYMVAGEPERAALTPMGSFNDWAWVRGALKWLGQKDPADTREQILEADPRRSELSDVLHAWLAAYGTAPVSLATIGQVNGAETEKTALRTLLIEMSGKMPWNAKSVGWWLRRNARRIIDGRCFVQHSAHKNGALWQIVTSDQTVSVGQEGQIEEEIPF